MQKELKQAQQRYTKRKKKKWWEEVKSNLDMRSQTRINRLAGEQKWEGPYGDLPEDK